jgi:hypothetical protein
LGKLAVLDRPPPRVNAQVAFFEHLPDGPDSSRLDLAVSADEWNIKIECRRCNDSVG